MHAHPCPAATPDSVSSLPLLARCVRGLEWVAAAEIRGRLAARLVARGHRHVRFALPQLTRELHDLGTVDDLFVVVAEASAGHTRRELQALPALATEIDLDAVAGLVAAVRERTPSRSFDVVVSSLGRRNFSRYEAEDAFGRALAAASGWAYRSRSGDRRAGGELSLRLHLEHERATVAVRVAERPLHRRAYRLAARPGSLHPPLARALALLAGVRPGVRLVDPFCGVGTIPIEAKLSCARIDASGYDLDPLAVAIARCNAATATVAVRFGVADAASLPLPDGAVDRIAANPPWGVTVAPAGRVRADSRAFMHELARVASEGCRVALVAPVGATRPPSIVLANRIRLAGTLADVVVGARDGRPVDVQALLAKELEEELSRTQPEG